MHLIIDIGNTLIKYYVFQEDSLIEEMREALNNWQIPLRMVLKQYTAIERVLISAVNGTILEKLEKELSGLKVLYCSMGLHLPFTTKYAPPHQLGADRIALLSACCLFYPNKNCLVIDLGSCITYDFIDTNSVHWGGSISPGFQMRYKSMHSFSGKLPLLEPNQSEELWGRSTATAIHSGVYHGILNELEGILEQYSQKFKF